MVEDINNRYAGSGTELESSPAAGAGPAALAAGGSVALIVGLFMPWAESLWISVSGMEAPAGRVLLLLGVLAAITSYRLNTGARAGGVLIIIGALAGLYVGGVIATMVNDESGMISAGNGVFVSGAGAIMLFIAGVQASAHKSRSR